MAMGLALKTGRFRVGPVSAFGVIGLLLAVWGGKFLTPEMTEGLRWSAPSLAWAIMIYGFAASVLPVWLLLAPRDYLSTFMKLGTVAVLGIFVVLLAPPLKMPAVTQFIDGSGWVVPGPVFPFVCITIACGAVSGFHSLISSGTTTKLLRRESSIRMIGYGSMITEMLVALMAIIAACALEPGQYFAINRGIDPRNAAQVTTAISEINAAGFPVTVAGMEKLAADLGEPTMIGRTGGAPTFAVGMAQMFAKVIPGQGMLALWYHFAIMFEALFILTTLDAGTRVGRFILQDLLGNVWAPLRDTRSWFGNVFASGLLVAAWGYFLYQGAVDPEGIAKSLWPIFGIANQLLAVIALCLGTTVLIKMGRARYTAVTLAPLVVLATVTFSAGWMKIFSPKAAGFLPAIEKLESQLAAGGAPASVAVWERQLFNARLDAGLTGMFLVFVAVIVAGSALEWWRLVQGRKPVVLRESEFVALPEES
jgi:carbon starvation protein